MTRRRAGESAMARRNLVLREDGRAGLHHRRRSGRRRGGDRAAGHRPARRPGGRGGPRRRPPAPARVLHQLGPPAARRPLRRRPRVPRRLGGAHDARPRAAGGGREGGQRVPAQLPPGRRADPNAGVIRPVASMVAIDNDTGEVRAMVGGPRLQRRRPFNLATQGQRQPGSAFKPFVLAAALRKGISPRLDVGVAQASSSTCRARTARRSSSSTTTRAPTRGVTTLASATTFSDNSVYAEVGYQDRLPQHRRDGPVPWASARRSRPTPRSRSAASSRASPSLDMAHAYETFATGGKRIEGTLGARNGGPVGIRFIRKKGDGQGRLRRARTTPKEKRGLRPGAGRRGDADPASRSSPGHRQPGADRGRLRGRQDRHDRELRRRLVRRLHRPATRSPSGSATRTASSRWRPSYAGVAGRRRHLPGADLARLHRDRSRRSSSAARPSGCWPTARSFRPTTTPLGTEVTPVDAHHHVRRAHHGRHRHAGRHRRHRPAGRTRRRPPTRRRRRPPSTPDNTGGAAPAAAVRPRRHPATPRRRPSPSRRVARSPGGHGLETLRLPAAQNRHGSSAALVMPIRGPTTISGDRARRRREADRPAAQQVGGVVVAAPMPSAWVSLPGPEHRSSTRSRPRRSRISSMPSTGSSARISTAAPTPSGSQTALSSAWMP